MRINLHSSPKNKFLFFRLQINMNNNNNSIVEKQLSDTNDKTYSSLSSSETDIFEKSFLHYFNTIYKDRLREKVVYLK